MTDSSTTPESLGIDPNASPWSVPPIAGISFDDDSEEARAIERIIERSERDAANWPPPVTHRSDGP